jgi:membrane protease YdiL (CAAX protease family)
VTFALLFDYTRTFIPDAMAAGRTPEAMRVMAIERFVLFGLVPLAVVVFGFRDRPSRYGLTLGDWRAGTILLVAGALVMTPVVLWFATLPDVRAFYAPSAEPLPGLVLTNLLDLVAAEFLFRGFLMLTLVRAIGPIGVLIATMPFAFAHLGKPELELLSTLGGGLVYGWLAWRTSSIAWGAIGHVYILSLVTIAAAPDLGPRPASGPGGPCRTPAANLGVEIEWHDGALVLELAPRLAWNTPHDLELDPVRIDTVERLRHAVVGSAAQGAGLGEDGCRGREVIDRRNLPGKVVEPHGAATRPRRVRPDREEPQIVVVAARGRAHEDRSTTERLLHDLEPEDPAVELRGRDGVAHVQDRVVEAGDRDAHGLPANPTRGPAPSRAPQRASSRTATSRCARF